MILTRKDSIPYTPRIAIKPMLEGVGLIAIFRAQIGGSVPKIAPSLNHRELPATRIIFQLSFRYLEFHSLP